MGLRTMLSELKEVVTGERIRASAEEVRESVDRMAASNLKLVEALRVVIAEMEKDPAWGARIVEPMTKALDLEPSNTESSWAIPDAVLPLIESELKTPTWDFSNVALDVKSK